MTAGKPTLRERREAAEALADLTSEPDGVDWSSMDVGGIRGLWGNPVGARTDQVLLYLHGGGYIVQSVNTHRRLGGHLAKAAGCRVFLVDYGLAPENPHPGPVADTTAAYRWMLDNQFRPDQIAIAGDSSGGGLALATMLKVHADKMPLPAAVVAFSPWTDLEMLGDTVVSNADRDQFVTADGLRALAENFLAGGDPRDPLAAPIYGDYSGGSPIYIQVGADEVLLDDSLRVADSARNAGTAVTLDVFPGMQHVFQMRAGSLPEADDAIARVGVWLRTRLGTGDPA